MRLLRSFRWRPFQLPAGPSLAVAGFSGGDRGPAIGRWPLPITATTIALLLALPLLALQRLPRPRAQGLEQLLDGVTLLQSFPAAPQRAIPDLWRQRLGGRLAERAWQQQRGFWWQLWGEHVDGAPMLVLPATSLPAATVASLPPQAMRLGDLVVVAPDPLALQMLRDGLRPQQRRSRGLQRRCLDRLQSTQAVFWNPTAIGVIAGPIAPLLQRFQSGCLSIGLDGGGVVWSGEAAAVDGALTSVATTPTLNEPAALGPLPADQLLQIQGASLDLLIQGLLARQMIRDPLASRYGIDTDRLALLRQPPFQLRLRSVPHGPFQASLELQLVVGKERLAWQGLLDQLGRSLQAQGLRQADATAPVAAANGHGSGSRSSAAAPPAPGAITASPGGLAATTESRSRSSRPTGSAVRPALATVTWSRDDGAVVGGWRWLPTVAGEAQLLLFLGPVPQTPLARIGGAAHPLPAAGGLQLRSRPAALARFGMLPPDVPELVRRSSQLELEAQSLQGGTDSLPISQLSGRLQVSR